jgi:hypothetical protein
MREFDLNIERVLENWTVAHALREAKCISLVSRPGVVPGCRGGGAPAVFSSLPTAVRTRA